MDSIKESIDTSILSLIDPAEREALHPDTKKLFKKITSEQHEPSTANQVPDIMSRVMPVILDPDASADKLRTAASSVILALNNLAIEHMQLRKKHDAAILHIVYEPLRREKYSLRTGSYIVHKDC